MSKEKELADAPWYYIDPEEEPPEEDEEGLPIAGSDPMVNACAAQVTQLEGSQQHAKYVTLKLMEMYSNRDLLRGTYLGEQIADPVRKRQLHNQTAICLDTLVAKLVDNECHVVFDVDGADWDLGDRAENLEGFVAGEFYRLSLYSQLEDVARDAGSTGDGWIKFTQLNGKVHSERVFPIEMVIDTSSTVSAAPTEIYQVRYVTRAYAKKMLSEYADIIDELPAEQPQYAYVDSAKLVRLVEAYHLPDAYSKGWKLVFCGNILIERTEWKRQRFPYVRFAWSKCLAGGYSIGLVEQLAPSQLELNKVKIRKSQSINLLAVPRVWQSAGTTISPDWDNRIGWVHKYTGEIPKTEVSLIVPPDLWNEEKNIKSDMLLQAGISPFDAQQDSPSRVDSRPGLRELSQLASQRHALVSKNWERLHLDCARQIIDTAREIVKDNGKYSSLSAASEYIEEIDWSKADIEDERFRMKLQPASLLPSTPTGKRLAINDLALAGAFDDDKTQLWQLLTGHPDIKRAMDLKMAGQNLVKKQMYLIVSRREKVVPDEMQDTNYCKRVAQQTYWMQRAKVAKTPESKQQQQEVLDLLNEYIFACEQIDQQVLAKQQQDQLEAQQQAEQQAMLAQQAQGIPPDASQPGQPAQPPSPAIAGGPPPGSPIG